MQLLFESPVLLNTWAMMSYRLIEDWINCSLLFHPTSSNSFQPTAQYTCSEREGGSAAWWITAAAAAVAQASPKPIKNGLINRMLLFIVAQMLRKDASLEPCNLCSSSSHCAIAGSLRLLILVGGDRSAGVSESSSYFAADCQCFV